MCGDCIFPKTFLDKVIGKTVKNFECNDSDSGSEVTITFTDNVKLTIISNIHEVMVDFKFGEII